MRLNKSRVLLESLFLFDGGVERGHFLVSLNRRRGTYIVVLLGVLLVSEPLDGLRLFGRAYLEEDVESLGVLH